MPVGFPTCARRPRMDECTFSKNFGPQMPHETYLCYEVEQPEGNPRTPADQLKGFLRNKVTDHSRQGSCPGTVREKAAGHTRCPLSIVLWPHSFCGFAKRQGG